MIKLTGLNDREFVINADHIEKLTETPQSVITLTNGNKYVVKESNDEIIRKVIEYKRKIYRGDFK
ncbi:flagellar FlbD family protein [Clostridium sp. MT-14]|jgi:flagellar protein FlbD|uniref:Flagellar FlbD family protein n=1 Tax=Clostridium aromativorans TaxID=2836848 RepID=A0ABS8N483_9CLOT|nr:MULTISPECIES: flagellar FlbD family protein [Clostridium]KAA8675192.1 flagellar FlbD family protein [Clostridium sp. HV4-5-A1G]MCC9293984.1 flagellar FlbD family protein [Clostridium aromativorans]CAB1242047.1 flagellar power transducer required for swarming [Clostridiaceae bacterium BL-3]